jgi:hypothetical protein
MDETCDRHPTARAKARIILPSGGVLYACGHCARTLDYSGEFTIEYEAVAV